MVKASSEGAARSQLASLNQKVIHAIQSTVRPFIEERFALAQAKNTEIAAKKPDPKSLSLSVGDRSWKWPWFSSIFWWLHWTDFSQGAVHWSYCPVPFQGCSLAHAPVFSFPELRLPVPWILPRSWTLIETQGEVSLAWSYCHLWEAD